MTMFARRARLRPGEGGVLRRRPKRVKTHHTAEDQVIREFQDILGHLRAGHIGGPPIPQYDGGVEENEHAIPDLGDRSDDALPEADLKSVPQDPSLQALWVAREIKKLAVYNERHMDQNRGRSMSTASPISPTFSMSASNYVHENKHETPDSSLKSSRSSGRKRRQTTKAKDSHLVDLDVHDESLWLTDANRNPNDGLGMLSALVTNQRIHHALSHSLNLGPGNFEKRAAFGIQFLQSMAADTLPPDPAPAAKLKHSLWRSRNHMPFFAALHILAGFDEVVQAIDVAFHGRLNDSTSLTKREALLHYGAQLKNDPQVNGDGGSVHLNGVLGSKGKSLSTRVKLVHRKSGHRKAPVLFSPKFFPGSAPEAATDADVLLQNEGEPSFETAPRGSDSEESGAPEVTGPKHFTPIDPNQSARAVDALNGATAILDDMAYGAALKHFFMPQPNGPLQNQYLTPYGTPGSNTYVTPYANPPPGQQQQVTLNPTASQQAPAGPQLGESDAASNTETRVDATTLRGGALKEADRQNVFDAKGKGKEVAMEQAPGPDDVLESTETDKDNVEAAKPMPVTSNQEGQDGEEDFTQIDSFLALAAGEDSDSDDETDRDKTISREMTPVAPLPGDPAIESIVQGIIGELATNQNWGHGIGFLTPQTHLYQITNAHRFTEGLRRYVEDARIQVNCVVSAEQSRAQQALFNALIKRITNPYLDGTLRHYSNVVYHNGRAYQAIPGPAHPMYQQQLPYPPPPPPSSQMILPSQGPPPMTPPVGSTRRASSSRATSTRETLKMIREFGFQPPVSHANSSQNQSRPSSQEYPTRNPSRPAVLHIYENSESDHAPIVIQEPLKRKRTSG